MAVRYQDHLRIFALSLAVFASVMSTSMLAIAFPDLVTSFSISYSALQWRNVLFFTLFAVGLPLFGQLADRWAPRRQLMTGMVLFCVASLMSALSTSWTSFLLFQCLQAVADSMIVPVQAKLIRSSFPEHRIGWAFGWFSGVLSTATLIGPALGGVLLKFGSWHTLFWCLFAIAAIAALLVLFNVPPVEPTRAGGHMPLQSSLCLLVFVLGAQLLLSVASPAPSRISGAVLALAGLVALIYSERRTGARGKLFPRSLGQNQAFVTAMVRVFFLFLATNAVALYGPSYLRDVQHLAPSTAGGIVLLSSLVGLLLSGFSGRLADQNPRRTLTVGVVLSMAGLALFGLAGAEASLLVLALVYLLMGLGSSITMPSQNKIAMLTVPREQTGSYMGVFQLMQFVSGAFSAGIFSSFVEGDHPGRIAPEGFGLLVATCLAFQLIALLTQWRDRVRAAKPDDDAVNASPSDTRS